MSAPQLAALLPVEDALLSVGLPDRRISLYRLFADLYDPSFPASARMTVAMVLLGGSGEFTTEVVLRDPLQRELVRVSSRITAANLHVQLFNLAFVLDNIGDNHLEGLIEGQLIARVPIAVREIQPVLASPISESAA
jgi:hypothetical protein